MKTIIRLIILSGLVWFGWKTLREKNISPDEATAIVSEWLSNRLEVLAEQIGEHAGTYEINVPERQVEPPRFEERTEVPRQVSASPARDYNRPVSSENALETKIPENKSSANPRFYELDRYAAAVPVAETGSMERLVEYLVRPAKNELEKARLLFTWIALNVHYDDQGFNTGRYGDLSGKGVFESRTAVCEGFSNLFTEMGKMAGLEAVKVSGYAKGVGHSQGRDFSRTNHAWNLVRIRGEWKLMDVTWASGHGSVRGGRLVTEKRFDDFWFDTDPHAFIFSHLPEEPQWQLLAAPIDKARYERLPYISKSFFRLGFDPQETFARSTQYEFSGFPETYGFEHDVRALSLPYESMLQQGKLLRLRMKSSDGCRIAAINNGEWLHFKKEGDVHELLLIPERGKLSIYIAGPGEDSFTGLLAYQVR